MDYCAWKMPGREVAEWDDDTVEPGQLAKPSGLHHLERPRVDNGWKLPPWQDWKPVAPPVSRKGKPSAVRREVLDARALLVYHGPLTGGRGTLTVRSLDPAKWRVRPRMAAALLAARLQHA